MSIYTRHNGSWHKVQPTPAPAFSLPEVTAEGEVLTTTTDSYDWEPLAAYTKEESDAKYATTEYVDQNAVVGSPGLIHLARVDVAGAAEIIADNVFSSTYDVYKINFHAFQEGTTGTLPPVFLELRAAGVKVGGTNYGTSILYNDTGGSPVTAYAASQSASQISNIGNASSYANLDLHHVGIGARTKHFTGTYGGFGDAQNYSGSINSWCYQGMAADGLRIWPQSGVFTEASLDVYAYSQGA
jgi:hypothetical protein